MNIGYIRVSTDDQNTIRQEALMAEMGVEKVYIEKASGKSADRPVLKEMMAFVREGDTLVVESISRFARNTRDLLSLMEQLIAKGVVFVSQKEDIDTNTPTGMFMLTVFGAVAELEREYILQRQREGIAEAKKAGKYKGRKPIAVDRATFRAVYTQWRAGVITAVRAQKQLNLSPNTFYRRVKEFEKEENGKK
jgi:DNA invertase Pin-like site-specific DNA recombinase